MNKLVGLVIVISALVAIQEVTGKEDRRRGNGNRGQGQNEKYKKAVEECKTQAGATDEDVKNFFSKTEELSSKGKCFAGCFYEKKHLIVDGAFSKENCDKWIAKKYANNPEKQDKAKAAVAECDAALADVPKEKCQTGPAIRQCFARVFKKMHDKNNQENDE